MFTVFYPQTHFTWQCQTKDELFQELEMVNHRLKKYGVAEKIIVTCEVNGSKAERDLTFPIAVDIDDVLADFGNDVDVSKKSSLSKKVLSLFRFKNKEKSKSVDESKFSETIEKSSQSTPASVPYEQPFYEPSFFDDDYDDIDDEAIQQENINQPELKVEPVITEKVVEPIEVVQPDIKIDLVKEQVDQPRQIRRRLEEIEREEQAREMMSKFLADSRRESDSETISDEFDEELFVDDVIADAIDEPAVEESAYVTPEVEKEIDRMELKRVIQQAKLQKEQEEVVETYQETKREYSKKDMALSQLGAVYRTIESIGTYDLQQEMIARVEHEMASIDKAIALLQQKKEQHHKLLVSLEQVHIEG